ncbi:MAG: hypothetical protein R3B09_08245 [Nannocystaceae bacterium]
MRPRGAAQRDSAEIGPSRLRPPCAASPCPGPTRRPGAPWCALSVVAALLLASAPEASAAPAGESKAGAAAPSPASSAATPTSAETPEAVKARAAEAVARGSAAFEAGDYPAAIVGFEEALALRPAAKLHYNLGICHQRLMQAAADRGDAATEAAEASAAIVALNRYLVAKPSAEDRGEVEAMIRALGGIPVSPPPPAPAPTRPTEPSTSPSRESAANKPEAGDPSPSPPLGPAPIVPRGALGVYLGLAAVPQLQGDDKVEGAGLGSLGLRGNAHLGARRRLLIGGEAELGGGGNKAPTRLALTTQGLALTLGYALPVGRGHRVELPFVFGAGVGREAVRTRADLERPTCAVGSGTLVGKRVGGRVSGRVGIAVLVGARRNHGLGLNLGAVLTAFGRGPQAEGCSEPIYAELGIPRARVAVGLDLAYTVRF